MIYVLYGRYSGTEGQLKYPWCPQIIIVLILLHFSGHQGLRAKAECSLRAAQPKAVLRLHRFHVILFALVKISCQCEHESAVVTSAIFPRKPKVFQNIFALESPFCICRRAIFLINQIHFVYTDNASDLCIVNQNSVLWRENTMRKFLRE